MWLALAPHIVTYSGMTGKYCDDLLTVITPWDIEEAGGAGRVVPG